MKLSNERVPWCYFDGFQLYFNNKVNDPRFSDMATGLKCFDVFASGERLSFSEFLVKLPAALALQVFTLSVITSNNKSLNKNKKN